MFHVFFSLVRVVWHCEIHLAFFSDWNIVTCNLNCMNESHYHCPYCSVVMKSPSKFETHLSMCSVDESVQKSSAKQIGQRRSGSDQSGREDTVKKVAGSNSVSTLHKAVRLFCEACRMGHSFCGSAVSLLHFQHISMVQAFGDLKILKGSDNLYRCPLCTDLLFPPCEGFSKVEKHFTAQHWYKKIPFKGKKIGTSSK